MESRSKFLTPNQRWREKSLDFSVFCGILLCLKEVSTWIQSENYALLAADTNGDGIIDIDDATHLQKYLAAYEGIVLGKQAAT